MLRSGKRTCILILIFKIFFSLLTCVGRTLGILLTLSELLSCKAGWDCFKDLCATYAIDAQ